MSDLYRSAISARLSRLPSLPMEDEEEEMVDAIGDLPGSISGIGPPAMQVNFCYDLLMHRTKCSYKKIEKGPIVTYAQNLHELLIRNFLPFLHLVSSKMLCKFRFPRGIWIVVSITPHRNSVMGPFWFAITVQDTQVSVLPVLPRRLRKWRKESVVYSLWMLDDMVTKSIYG